MHRIPLLLPALSGQIFREGSNTMRLTVVLCLALAAAVLAAASAASGAGAPASARLLAPPKSLTAGGAATVRVKVSAGNYKTKAATVKLVLSSDAKLGAGDTVLGSKPVGALNAHRSKTLSIRATVPPAATAGK